MKRIISFLILILMLIMPIHSVWAESAEIDLILDDTVELIINRITNPSYGEVGGEWAIFGLTRSGYNVPEGYFENYYKNIEEYLKNCGGVLHKRKYTEYSRLIIALTAMGKNPENVAGYNLLAPLADYESVIYQGISGPIWALIALDCGNYELPHNSSASREMYIDKILQSQKNDGGFALSGGADEASDPDVTFMALTALSKYRYRSDVKAAIEKSLNWLSAIQTSDGFSSYGAIDSESAAQAVVAFCELGISIDDERFVKDGKTVLDNLLTFYDGNGGFSHIKGGAANQMATEQCLYALAALRRTLNGKSSLFSMKPKPMRHLPFILPDGGYRALILEHEFIEAVYR